MSKTYFAVSDIHSYYKPLMEALEEAGYDSKNPEHVLIVCGDVFDRGPDSVKILKFLQDLPKENRVLIRGNHEYLFRDCLERGFFMSHDESNGTERTMCNLIRIDPDKVNKFVELACHGFMTLDEYRAECHRLRSEINTKPFKSRKLKNLKKWIFSDEWKDYFRLGKYVFVHGWIPVLHTVCVPEDLMSYDEDWESRSGDEWEYASWLCPWRAYLDKLGPSNGDTIVCGHWHVQDFHLHLGKDPNGYDNREIYYSKDLIALDAMTAMRPHVCNVLVIKDGVCYDKHGNVLKDREENK